MYGFENIIGVARAMATRRVLNPDKLTNTVIEEDVVDITFHGQQRQCTRVTLSTEKAVDQVEMTETGSFVARRRRSV